MFEVAPETGGPSASHRDWMQRSGILALVAGAAATILTIVDAVSAFPTPVTMAALATASIAVVAWVQVMLAYQHRVALEALGETVAQLVVRDHALQVAIHRGKVAGNGHRPPGSEPEAYPWNVYTDVLNDLAGLGTNDSGDIHRPH